MTEEQKRAHRLYVDAVIGAGFASMEAAIAAHSAGWATFTGNQHNPSWRWSREALMERPTEMVLDLWKHVDAGRDTKS